MADKLRSNKNMLSEERTKKLLESYERCKKAVQPSDDMYWSGAVVALREVLEVE